MVTENGTPSGWLEVSLEVDGELAEAVADVLARFAPEGVVIEATAIKPDPAGEGWPTGPLQVVCYLPMDPQVEEKRQRLEEVYGIWDGSGRFRRLNTTLFSRWIGLKPGVSIIVLLKLASTW